MSFKNSMQALQRFVINSRYAFPHYENIDAVLDARRLNTTILDGDISKEGKLRQIKITHYPIDCDAVAESCDGNLCDTGTLVEPVQEWFYISRCIQLKPKTLRVEDVRDVDGNWSFSDHAMALINAQLGTARRELSREIDALLLANKGLHLDGNQYRRVTMTNTATGVVQPVGLWEIEQEFADGGYINPFVMGSKEVYQWKKALGIATDNSATGQALARIGSTNVYYDTTLNSVVGDTSNGEYIIAFDPQSLKFVSYNDNLGLFATDLASPEQLDQLYKRGGTDYMKGVLQDPENGLLWDFFLNFDKCAGDDGTFTFFLRLKWDIFFPRVESCNIQGVNGVFVYKTCPVVQPACPSGDTPSPAAASHTYSWTPGLSYPFILSEAQIGGIETYPNVAVTSITDLVAAMNDSYGVSIFTVSGSNVHYTGYSPITGSLNSGEVTVTFA
jgi:hypothetical protein